MPCSDTSHVHDWPDEGELVVEKCERFCAYCTGDAALREWKFPWFLRRHIRTVHAKEGDRPNLIVSGVWNITQTSSPASNSKKRLSPTGDDSGSPVKKRKPPAPRTPVRGRRHKIKDETPPPPSPPSTSTTISPSSSSCESLFAHSADSDYSQPLIRTPDCVDKDEITFSDPTDLWGMSGAQYDDGYLYSPDHHIPVDLNNYACSFNPPPIAFPAAFTMGSESTLVTSSVIAPAVAPANQNDSDSCFPHPTLQPSATTATEQVMAVPVDEIERLPTGLRQVAEEAKTRHYAVLDIKLAYRDAIRDLSRQGAKAGLTSAEIGVVTADEVDRLMSMDDADELLDDKTSDTQEISDEESECGTAHDDDEVDEVDEVDDDEADDEHSSSSSGEGFEESTGDEEEKGHVAGHFEGADLLGDSVQILEGYAVKGGDDE